MNPMSKLPLIDKRMKIMYLPDHLVSQHYPKDFWVRDIFSEGYTIQYSSKSYYYILCRFRRNWKLSMGYQSPVRFCRFGNYWIFSWRQTYLCPWNWSPYSEIKIWKKYLPISARIFIFFRPLKVRRNQLFLSRLELMLGNGLVQHQLWE